MSDVKFEYYKSHEVEAFMNLLGKKKKIKPEFDLTLGYRYPDVEKATGLDSGGAVDFLERLVNVEIIEKDLYDMELRCTNCNSPNLSVNYVCPKCVSTYIKKTILLEHKQCGYIGTLITFGEPLICPKCEKKIKASEYHDAGSIYTCAVCEQQIETPFIDHWCRDCGEKFSFETAIYQPKYSFVPTKFTMMEMDQGIIYPSQIVSVFEELGFAMATESKYVGESGVEHIFDLAFECYGSKFFVDIHYSSELMGELDLLKQYGKVRDVKATLDDIEVFQVILPGLDHEAEVAAKSYDLNLIVGKGPRTILSKLKIALAEKVNTLKSLALLENGTSSSELQTPKGSEVSKSKRGLRSFFERAS